MQIYNKDFIIRRCLQIISFCFKLNIFDKLLYNTKAKTLFHKTIIVVIFQIFFMCAFNIN